MINRQSLENIVEVQDQGQFKEINWSHIQLSSEEGLINLIRQAKEHRFALIPGQPRFSDYLQPCFSNYSNLIFYELSERSSLENYYVEDQVVSVWAGMKLCTLDHLLAKDGLQLPGLGISAQKTIFELINTGLLGRSTYKYSTVRDLVLGMKVAVSPGKSINCGGIVVKNVSGYDMNKLFIGSQAWLGIPYEVTLRLSSLASKQETVLVSSNNLVDLLALERKIVLSGLSVLGLEIFSGQLLEDINLADRAKKYVLLIIMQGLSEEVKEATQSLLELTQEFNTTDFQNLQEKEEKELLKKLTFSADFTENTIQISANPSQLNWLIPFIDDFQARFAVRIDYITCAHRGNLCLRMADSRFLEAFNENIKEELNKRQEYLYLAGKAEAFEYQFRRLPNQDNVELVIRERLKFSFDSDFIFNPLAQM